MPRIPDLAFHLAVTGAEITLAVIAAIVLGATAGVVVRRAPGARAATPRSKAPSIAALCQMAPLVLLAPLPAMWLGSGSLPKVAFGAALGALPMALAVMRQAPFHGLRAVPAMTASAVLVAELVGGTKGLGFLVAFGHRQNSATLVLVAALLAAGVALAAYGAVVYAERCLVRRPKAASAPDYIGA